MYVIDILQNAHFQVGRKERWRDVNLLSMDVFDMEIGEHKGQIFWEGHKMLQNLHFRFDWHYIGQIYGGDFAKFWGHLRIYEL